MTILSMTFDENYGNVPTRLLSLYKRHNVSPADHDRILAALGFTYADRVIPWGEVLEFVLVHIDGGVFRLPLYL